MDNQNKMVETNPIIKHVINLGILALYIYLPFPETAANKPYFHSFSPFTATALNAPLSVEAPIMSIP